MAIKSAQGKIMECLLIIYSSVSTIVIAVTQVLLCLPAATLSTDCIVLHCLGIALFATTAGIVQRTNITSCIRIAFRHLFFICRKNEVGNALRHLFCDISIMQIARNTICSIVYCLFLLIQIHFNGFIGLRILVFRNFRQNMDQLFIKFLFSHNSYLLV